MRKSPFPTRANRSNSTRVACARCLPRRRIFTGVFASTSTLRWRSINSYELMLRHLSVDVDAKTPVKILLRGKHLAQATLVLFDRFALVGKGDFRIDHERKIHDNKFAQNPGESGIREVFQADPRIEKTADLEVVILFIFDVHVRHLASGAFVPERLVWWAVRQSVIA